MTRLPSHLARRFATVAALVCLSAASAGGQETGGIHGSASDDATGAPLAFTLVRLLPADRVAVVLHGAVTDSAGAFRFTGLRPGVYRLQLDRIGFEPTISGPVAVGAGNDTRYDLRPRSAPVEIAGVVARADRCYAADDLAAAPDLATLWREARDGLELRREFARAYHYRYERHEEQRIRFRVGRVRTTERDTVVVSEPDSVLAREARLHAEREAEGFGKQSGTTLQLHLPSGVELLDEAFLETHCLEGDVQTRGSEIGISFRPIHPIRGRIDIRGTLWIDAQSYAIRDLLVEHLRGAEVFSTTLIRHAEVAVPGGTIQLPLELEARGRVPGLTGVVIRGFEIRHRFEGYGEFLRVR